MSKMIGWNVYHNNKYIDRVYFNDMLSKQEVLNSLIIHNGYPFDIEIKESN